LQSQDHTYEKSFPLFIKQLYNIGVLSLLIIVASAFFIGMVLGLQGYAILVGYGSEQAVGQLIALTLLRELAPVIAALLFAGRAGSSITAEIGMMSITEQLATLEVMGINPLHRIIAPRFLAGMLSMPILVIIFNIVGIAGGAWVAIDILGIDSGSFWTNMQNSVQFSDVINSLIKAVVFAFIVMWIAVYQGYTVEHTTEGIAYATTRTVVYSSFAILGLDFMLTTFMFGAF
jgi:phospholipid/cholesterol/gamma-HCH transport system permease protein